MSLSNSTIAAIQKAGAVAFAATEKIKKEALEQGKLVTEAITKNPFNLGNDALIENWKTTARLAQTLANIEEELKTAFQTASELSVDDQPRVRELPVLLAPVPAPARSAKNVATGALKLGKKKSESMIPLTKKSATVRNVTNSTDLTPVDAVVKPKKKKLVVKSPGPQVRKVRPVGQSPKSGALSANAAKLLAYFERTLNSNEFLAMSQTAASQETGIPLGSMTAAIKKLVDAALIAVGDDGHLKLLATPAQETGQAVVKSES